MYLCAVNNILAEIMPRQERKHSTDTAEALNYNGALDFHDGDDSTCEYDYDSNGALTRDSNRGINSITYDYGHHTYLIDLDLNNRPRNITNDYTPDGRKLLSKHVMSIPKAHGYTKKTTTDKYIDGLTLRGDTTLMWRFDGGYVELNANGTPTRWNYYVTDHLSSTRMIVDSNDNIRKNINYYPFGSEMRMEAPAQMTNNLGHPFRFTGKELDRMNSLNMYDFGARMYDVAGVPMWTSIDPLAEKYYNVSPYSYCAGDPVNKFDPDGRKIVLAEGVSESFRKDYELTVKTFQEKGCADTWNKLESSSEVYTITESNANSNYFDYSNKTISWNSRMGLWTEKDVNLSPATRLNHELAHALHYETDPEQYKKDIKTPIGGADETYTVEEKQTIQGVERQTAERFGEVSPGSITRNDHGGIPFATESPLSNKNINSMEVIITNNKKI